MALKTGVQKRIVALLEDSGETTLWSMDEILAEIGGEKHPLENNLQTMRIHGYITRHKERHEDGSYQFAINLPDKDIDPYVKMPRSPNGTNLNPYVSKKKKKKVINITPKGVRLMFAQLHNDLAKLEDDILSSLEQAEETERKFMKLHNVMNGI